jgi:protein SCO1/2
VWKRLRKPELPTFGPVPAFTLDDQDGKPFDSRALAGKVWVADFVFTSCSEICPRMTQEMQRLQQHLLNRGLDRNVRLVSISVDPERDTPERLRGYAEGFAARREVWSFLTGDQKKIEDAVVNGFKQSMEKEVSDGGPDAFTILHGTRFVLVDARGIIRGYYDPTESDARELLRKHIAQLVERGGS